MPADAPFPLPEATRYLDLPNGLALERGGHLAPLRLAYQTWGQLNAQATNVVWVCHALTANANAPDWWPGVVGPGTPLDPARYFIVCANILGSCYGTTGPTSPNPAKPGQVYGLDFPEVTIRDQVAAHQALADHLGVRQVGLLLGGSMGGMQALEWAAAQPERIGRLFVIATNAQHSPWGIAFNHTQRLALAADPTFYQTPANPHTSGRQGMVAARAVAMLSYRHYATYHATQPVPDHLAGPHLRPSTYQAYQGEKLANRFGAHAYYRLSQAMDSHDLGRGRGGVAAALAGIRARTLVMGLSTDILFPPAEQRALAGGIAGAAFAEIDSLYGHDGFLLEHAAINHHLAPFLAATGWGEPNATHLR